MKEPISTTFIIKNLLYIPVLFVGFPTIKIIILSYLILLDIFTGLLASYRVCGSGKCLTSRKMTSGIISKSVVMIIPVTLFLLAKGIADIDLTFFVSATISGLMLAETYSIIGNIQMIRTGEKIEEYDAINLIIKGIRDGLEKLIKNISNRLWKN